MSQIDLMEEKNIQHIYRRLQGVVERYKSFERAEMYDSITVNFQSPIPFDNEGLNNPKDSKHHTNSTTINNEAFSQYRYNILYSALEVAQGILGGIGVQQLLEILTTTCTHSTSCVNNIFMQADTSQSVQYFCIIIVLIIRLTFHDQSYIFDDLDSSKSSRNPDITYYNIDRISIVISYFNLILSIQTVAAEMRLFVSEGSSFLRPTKDHGFIVEILIVIKSSMFILGWILFCVRKLLFETYR